MKIKSGLIGKKNKRHIEDVPFYAFEYKFGDLPLDPARGFIQEQIDKLKKAKPVEFKNDFDLFYHNANNRDLKPCQEITNHMVSLLKKKPRNYYRQKVKKLSALEINKRLRRKFFTPVDAVTPYKTISLEKFHLSFDRDKIKPRRIKDFPRNAIKSPEEYRRELEKVNKVINELLQPEIRRYEEIQQQIKDGSFFKYQRSATSSTSTSKTPSKKRKLSDEQYMIKLKAAEREKLGYFRAIMPMEVEDQRSRMLNNHTVQMTKQFAKFTHDIQERSIDLMTQVNVLAVQPYPSHLIVKILPKVYPKMTFLKEAYKFIQAEKTLWPNIQPEVMLMDFLFNSNRQIRPEIATMIMSLLMDLEEDFRHGLRRHILRKVLLRTENQDTLDLLPEPPDFPLLTIKAPVPWKCAIQVAKNRLDQILMITHPVLQAINMLWHELYSDLLIVDTSKMYKTDVPLDSGSMSDLVHACCVIARDILVNDWLPRLADLVDEMRKFWIDLVAFHSRHGGRATIMFKAIHALMSYQLQTLIKKSVDHLMATIEMYSGAQEHPESNLTKQPLMTLIVSVVGKYSGYLDTNTNEDSILYNVEIDDPHIFEVTPEQPATPTLNKVSFIIRHSGKIFVDPYMEELPDIFVNYFVKILKVGYNIPRMEYFMSQTSSEMGFLHCIPEDHIDMLQLYERVRKIVVANQTGPTTYLYPIYTYYFPILAGKMQAITENLFLQPTIPSLPTFRNLMEKYNELLFGVYYLRDFVPLNLFMLDNRRVNQVLAMMIKDMKDFVTDYFRTKNQVENRKVCDEFEEISLHAGGRPKETPEVVALQNYLNQCRDERLFVLKSEIKLVAERVMFLLHYATLDADDIHLNSRTFLWPSELEQVLDLSAARLSVVRDNLETALRERKVQFDGYLLTEKKKMDAFRMKEIRDVLTLDELKEKVETVNGLMAILEKCNQEAKAINVDENLLQIEQSSFPVLVELMEKMDPIEKLWHTAYQFDSCYEGWYYGPFKGLDAEKIREEVESMGKVIYKLSKALVTNPQAKRIAEQVRMKIDKFKIYLPVLEAICRQGLSERHWNQISEELGQEINPARYCTLASLVEVDIMRIVDRLEQISNAAGKEFELNTQLLQMQSEWTEVTFEVHPYRDSDTHILAPVDDIQTLLDDHILKAQAMRGSPYIAALGEKATNWEDKLISMQDILDIWLKVQSTWMYLEPIFNSEDIMRQMPQEGRNFKAVDRIWRKIMKHTEAERRVIQATDFPKMLEILQKAFVDLEGIQKGLNMYLEKKRQFFSRFYFLSNDELLEILSETKDPLRVQPHLKKCFEGIHALQFDQSMEIMAMISFDGEIVPLTKRINPASANGLVEKWLKEVQQVMFESIEEQLRSAHDIYYVTPRKTWCLKWAGQIVHTISCLTWTADVEEAITKGTLGSYYETLGQHMNEAVNMIRGDTLSDSQRITMESLLVLDVHKRDVVKELKESHVEDIGDFEWFAHLRYYWRVDDVEKQEFVCISMISTDIPYGMEYLGSVTRLIITPLTSRCFRTLMGALKLNLGGAPEGPAGSGKTETCKDLAKAVAKKCVVFNCSEGLDYKALGKFFKGLAQSGAWACFDEFNRINLEVLSVVAQQILQIQRAISKKAVKFTFEDATLKLDPTCNIFITMNPDQGSRNRIPDNLKVLFRTVAMMIPDKSLISEITLYTCGFEQSKTLAYKIVQVYKLCSEQMSTQCHYDYGMRGIKSVLQTARTLKKFHAEYSEQQVVLRALIDVNLPKFLPEDISLFENIYKDLFPNIELPVRDREDIHKWLEVKMQDRNLQLTDWFKEKILQIYETLLVRHGLVIVGGAMAGKTTAYQLLASVLREIQRDPEAKSPENGVNFRIINPKAISMGQLYGCFDPLSYEWQDGVLARTFREMAYTSGTERQWIIFDGPVDPIWIENLNTVLDDNKKLCLMSGEIVYMSRQMNLIFESDNLDQASPATVSRCGMIYMDSKQLGWESLHKSFLHELQTKGTTEIYMALYEALVNWLIPPLLDMLTTCATILPVSSLYRYRIFSTFFMAFLSKQTSLNLTWFQQTFLYCLVWSYCSTLTPESRMTLDSSLRKILYGTNDNYPKPKHFTLNRGQIFPEKMSFLDYRFDGTESWWPWAKAEDTPLVSDLQMMELIVPTKESGFIQNWLETCVDIRLPMLLVGPTGTGKSAIVNAFMRDLPKNKFLINNINLSARTTAQQVQELVMAKLDRRRKGVFGPPVGKKCLIFVDDMALPMRDKYGSQPALELIRQWLDHKHWSDLEDTSKLDLIDLLCIGAMGFVGGSNYIFERLYRHMFIVSVDALETPTMQRIFHAIGEWHFSKEYPDTLTRLSKALSVAAVELFTLVRDTFLPTPATSHYLFSLKDVSKVYQGMVLVPAKRLQDPEKLVRLWAHETYRVFYDRLVNEEDRTKMFNMVLTTCTSKLRMSLSQALGDRISATERLSDTHMRDLIFGNYMEPDADPKIYDEVENLGKLEKVMGYYLNEYNSTSTSPMDLVLFRFAIEHISRVARVLQIEQGNVLLIGLGGSGRRSAIKLAASMMDADLFQVEVTKSYTFQDWREDMKKLLIITGIEYKKTVFLFSDSQAKEESFFEDINSLLNTADINNLFLGDEKTNILDRMQNEAKLLNKTIDSTPLALYSFFTERIREKLHICISLSPIGDSVKRRMRTFPSLINCCTLDWFAEWPTDALVKVAETYITSMELSKKSGGDGTLDIAELESKLIEMIIYFNTSVKNEIEKFLLKLKRKNYVTPTLYLEMLHLFKTFHSLKYEEITVQRDRYVIGLEKLDSAAAQVGVMQKNLFELQPQLKILSEETEKIMVNIERETAEAEKKKEVVGADEAAANEAAASAQAIKDDCESDLQEAIPALEAALSALDTLKPADITVVKSMKNPPSGVKLVLEAVCVIKGIKPDRKGDPTGKISEDFWAPSLRMLGDMKFLESLKTFDKDNIPTAVMKRVRERYITDREFIPEKIKNVSMACEGLCRWVRAMEIYDRVAKIVAPKKVALAGAEGELAQQMEKLNAKRAELQEILDKLQKLNDFFAEKSREKKNLEDEIDNCEKKLVRAERLLGGLGGEKSRWSENAASLHKSLDNVVGDVLLAAGVVAYLGCFTTEFRAGIIQEWNSKCIEDNIPCTRIFSLAATLGNPMQQRAWTLCGLPADTFSVENGIIVSKARRYPLMIDPQGQANKWIKNLERDNDLQVIKQTDSDYMTVAENAIKQGLPLLLENVGEYIDSGLFPILERNVVKQKGEYFIRFGSEMIEYNFNFRFYITTCLRNPHYLPETAVLVTILNFMITEVGLKEQLLATVVVQERPDLQEKKEILIVESARNRDLLYNIETQILQVLSSSEGNILEDENAINILSSSKVLSEEIQAKQIIAVATEAEIDQARQLYLPVAMHSSILFFCITELANIEPMYQYSLTWFLSLFVQAIIKAPKSSVLEDRLENLNNFFTTSVYQNICRSLFEKDKLIFSFVICIGLLRAKKQIDEQLLVYFLSGTSTGQNNLEDNPAPDWLSAKSWTLINSISSMKSFKTIPEDFKANLSAWKEFVEQPEPHKVPLPSPYDSADEISRLIILKALRPDSVIPAVRNFIAKNLNDTFVQPPSFELNTSYSDSTPKTPLIFLLTPGSDPMEDLLAFAKDLNMYEKCHSISLGQGQGPKASTMIAEGQKVGHWVVLQNCHVATTWMDNLEKICIDLAEHEGLHKDFRLWCTAYPCPDFPVFILQNSIKMTNEPPKRLKLNMKKCYRSDPLANDKFFSEAFGENKKLENLWFRGVFALVYFHAVVQERREYGPLGWNIPYEFNETDLRITLTQLKTFIKQYEKIPFRGHRDLTGECNYGGRVTDDKDRRLLMSLLDRIYNEDSVQVENYALTSSGMYTIPIDADRVQTLEHISSFPFVANPEVFGLHENANIVKNTKETNALLTGVLITQTELLASVRNESLVKEDSKDYVEDIYSDILSRLPEIIDENALIEKFPPCYKNSLNVFLSQEIFKYNRLLKYIRKSLIDVQRATSGQIALIPQLESVHNAISVGRLPEDWTVYSYPSLKSLASYITDLIDRMSFFSQWQESGEPNVFWISAFFFPQSFITAILQNYARRTKKPHEVIDMIFDVSVYENETDLDFETFKKNNLDANSDFKCFNGLFLEGARWNRLTRLLDEASPRILHDRFPIVAVKPTAKAAKEKKHFKKRLRKYQCPIYKTSARRGTLSSTGHSTNFIMNIDLECKETSSHWINRGVACLCQVDE
ncbi:Dynein heavy chain [Sergentomyia squamirostris]